MRSQRSGERSTRRSDGKPWRSRNCAVATFAAIMKSSISSLAVFFSSGKRSASASPSNTARASVVSSVRAPRRWRRSFMACATRACRRSWSAIRGCAATLLGRLAGPVEPGGDGVVGELRLVPDERAVDVRCRHRPVGSDRHLDDDREPVVPLAKGRKVGRESLGQHREDLGRGVDGGRVRTRVAVERAARGHPRIDVGHRHEQLHGRCGEGLRDLQLVEVARVVVVDRRPRQLPEVADARPRLDRPFAEGLGLGEGRRREVGLQAARDHRAPGDGPQLVASRRSAPVHRLFRDPHPGGAQQLVVPQVAATGLVDHSARRAGEVADGGDGLVACRVE